MFGVHERFLMRLITIEDKKKENLTKETMFLRSKKGPFLVQVLSLERKCRYVCYWCLIWDIAASGV
jgi:hypothetical protein